MKQLQLTIALCLVIFGSIQNAHGQFDSYPIDGYTELSVKKATEFAERKLIVTTLEYDDDIVKKLDKNKDPEKLATYKATIKEFNADIKKMVDSLWTLNKSIKYMSYEDIKDIKGDDKSQYVVIIMERMEEKTSTGTSGKTYVIGNYDITFDNSAIGGIQKTNKIRSKSSHFTVMRVALLENLQFPNQMTIPMGHIVPQSTDIAFGLTYIDWYIRSKMADISDKDMMIQINEKSKELATLTLLISEEDAKDDDIMGKGSKVYPFKSQIVTKEELEAHILAKTPGYAYVNYGHNSACAVKVDNRTILRVPKPSEVTLVSTENTIAKMGISVQKLIEKDEEE
ncbi:MAG TPA: hypothetical protein PLB46_11185 [Chitinophagales bacterium]|nr:hypothetical protein [Chitinophagales bacterium]HRG02522.1 hypothetical protein [Bacteroidia bacterium]HRG85736.1 hypothetical protein [Chitinophagales bacterium]